MKLKDIITWAIFIILLVFVFLILTSCATESLTRPEYHQAQIIKIDTVNLICIKDWKITREKKLEITLENTQRFLITRYESVDSVRFVGEWSY
jgi:hypothetical protein